MESLKNYHLQLNRLMEKFVEGHNDGISVDLSHNGVTPEYYVNVVNSANELIEFYDNNMKRIDAIKALCGEYSLESKDDGKLAMLIDVIRCYDGLGHSTSFNTPEGIAIMIFLGKLYDVERILSISDLSDVDSGTLSLIDILPYVDECSHELGNRTKLLISPILESIDNIADVQYRKLLYKFCKDVASVDGEISIGEKEWLEEIARLGDNDPTNDIDVSDI